jgi:hypothetical protein
MSAKLRTHIRSNIIGYVALFFALSTGSAVALNGSNTVFTDDIVNDQVYSADVRNDTLSGGGLAAADLKSGSVGTSEVAADSLGAGDLAPSSVGTSEVANDSLTGTDVSEPSLGQVPSASNADTLDGMGSGNFLSTSDGGSVYGPVTLGAPLTMLLNDLVISGGSLVMSGGGGYIKFSTISGSAPDSSACDEAGEAGRTIVRTDGATNLYICTGATGWVGK